jgi:hypothetical protein
MLGKIIHLSAAFLAFIVFGIVPCFAQTRLTEFDALLVALPIAFEANISTVLLFQPDVGWVALVGGIFALVGFVVIPLINYVMKQSLGDQSGLLAVLVFAVPIASLFNPVRSRIQQTGRPPFQTRGNVFRENNH